MNRVYQVAEKALHIHELLEASCVATGMFVCEPALMNQQGSLLWYSSTERRKKRRICNKPVF
jgi:hypothetical protein